MTQAILTLASVLAACQVVIYLPQFLHLRRTGTAAGTSPLGQVLGSVSYVLWTVYLAAQEHWSLMVPNLLGAACWLGCTYYVLRRLPVPRWIGPTAVAYTGLYLLVLALFGWPGLGLALAASGVIAWIPYVRDVLSADDVSGLSRTTWTLVLLHEVGWLLYGAAAPDRALLAYACLTVPLVGVIWVRATTGPRATPAVTPGATPTVEPLAA